LQLAKYQPKAEVAAFRKEKGDSLKGIIRQNKINELIENGNGFPKKITMREDNLVENDSYY
jgi:hypothetical protein